MQIVTGVEVIADNCFPEMGKYYLRTKAPEVVT